MKTFAHLFLYATIIIVVLGYLGLLPAGMLPSRSAGLQFGEPIFGAGYDRPRPVDSDISATARERRRP